MIYRAMGLAAAIACGFAVKGAEAQDRWQGLYGGVVLSVQDTEASVQGSAVHDYDEDSLSLGVVGGFNNVRPSGFVWGPDVILTGLNRDERRNDAAVGATKLDGSFLLSPRLRLGFATDTAMFYGLVGLGISDFGIKQAGDGGTDIVMRGAIGLGVEIATSDRWSMRIEAASYNLDSDNRDFATGERDTHAELHQINFALSRSF